jgi:YVTN family beta-propeller protein
MNRTSALMKVAQVIVMIAWTSSPALAAETPKLSVINPFVPIGTSATFTITGAPGSSFAAILSTQPAEVPLGARGTLFLKPGTTTTFASGTIGGDGSAPVQLAIPNSSSLNGVIFYVQALVTTSGQSRFTNAVPIRAQSKPAADPRVPLAIAAAPDGTKAYVAHQLDGSVTVIDAAADVKMADLPVGPSARAIPHRAMDVAVDPEGGHAFIANAAAAALTIIDVTTDSVAAQFPVPKGCRRIAFDFSVSPKRVYVTNEVTNSILVITETTPGSFGNLDPIPLQGLGPGPIAVLPNGLLMVGHRTTLELEVVDPDAAPGSGTVARIPLPKNLPVDIAVSGGEALVPTFTVIGMGGPDGVNQVLRVDLSSYQVTGALFDDQGTDYKRVAVNGTFTAVVASGSGVVLLADSSTDRLLDRVDVGETGSGSPTATPRDAVFIGRTKLYVVDHFRDTVRPVFLGSGPPFALGPEIALAHSGLPRLPLSGQLSPAEEGEWFFRSVQFFNGGPFNPNPVTCQTCHTDGASDNITVGRQPQPMFGLGSTGPYFWQGTSTNLLGIIRGTFTHHGKIGGTIMNNADFRMQSFLSTFAAPTSVYLGPNGVMSSAAQAGKALFEGAGGCTTCHAAPNFIPLPPNPLTISGGVGTGLAPVNVPTLRGVWATAPYLHDGRAATLREVFLHDAPADVHSNLTQGFTDAELDQLVAYLNSL